jgi:hypothetical protein
MAIFTLPAGTVVKYGCTSTALTQLLEHGIRPSVVRQGLSTTDTPTNATIYIGELMAYFASCAAFCAETSEFHAKHQDIMLNFVEHLQSAGRSRPSHIDFGTIADEAGLPIVLEIELAQDCEIAADTHFTSDTEAEKSWKLWRSAAIKNIDSIPSAWIKRFYFPRLLEYRNLTDEKNARGVEQTSDCALLVGGMMQAFHKDTPGELLVAYKQHYGRINFSQSMPFDAEHVARYFKLNAMQDPATRLLNQLSLWQDIDALAKKQNMSLA